MLRRKTRSVKLGTLGIGSGFPVTIQSMTNIPLRDVERTLAQIRRCAALGCDIHRVAVDDEEAEKLIRDAKMLEEAGCFAIVIEKVPAALAERVAKELTIPVIGIGAGGGVDGQVLVVADMLGMTNGFSPRFLRRYADLHSVMTNAISQYVEDVKNCDFPNEKEQY